MVEPKVNGFWVVLIPSSRRVAEFRPMFKAFGSPCEHIQTGMTPKQPSSLDTSAKKAPTGKPSPIPRPDVRSKVSSFGYGFQWGTSKDKNPHPRVCHFGAKELVQSISPELPSNQALLQQLRRRLLEFPEPYRGVSVFEARPPFGTERIRLSAEPVLFLFLLFFCANGSQMETEQQVWMLMA